MNELENQIEFSKDKLELQNKLLYIASKIILDI